MGNIYATFKNSPRGLLYWEIHSKPQGTMQELPTTVLSPRSQGTKEQWVPKHRRKHSHMEHATLGNGGQWICGTADRKYGARISLLPDPPHLLSGLPSDQSNRRDKLASPLVNFQRSPSRGGEKREDSRVDPWRQRHESCVGYHGARRQETLQLRLDQKEKHNFKYFSHQIWKKYFWDHIKCKCRPDEIGILIIADSGQDAHCIWKAVGNK